MCLWANHYGYVPFSVSVTFCVTDLGFSHDVEALLKLIISLSILIS
jgi:hypothetical protein